MGRSEREIIGLVKAGDASVFRELVVSYQERGMSLALRLLRNREDAEEALQDAFLRAFNGMKDFRMDSKFGTWFYRIVYNVCLTKLERSPKLRIVDPPAEREDGGEELPDPDSSPAGELERKDLAKILHAEIDRLPEQYRTVLSLFYFQELGYDEICEVVGLPLGTVKTHLFRARTMLYNILLRSYSSKEELL